MPAKMYVMMPARMPIQNVKMLAKCRYANQLC